MHPIGWPGCHSVTGRLQSAVIRLKAQTNLWIANVCDGREPPTTAVRSADYPLRLNYGDRTVTSKIVVVALLCAAVAFAACRREEAAPMKLGGPTAEQPAR